MGSGKPRQDTPEQALPPPPLSEPTGTSERLGPLPWSTPLLIAVAGGLSGVVWRHWYAGPLWPHPAVRYFVLAGGLMGLGVCVMDRAAASWHRGIRWAIGLSGGIAAFILAACVYWVQQPYLYWRPALFYGPLAGALPDAVLLTVVCPPLGLLLGLLAGGPRTRWLAPLGAMGWLALVAAAMYPLSRPPSVLWRPFTWRALLPFNGLGHMINAAFVIDEPMGRGLPRYALSDAVLGLLIGLAMAVAASRAGKRF